MPHNSAASDSDVSEFSVGNLRSVNLFNSSYGMASRTLLFVFLSLFSVALLSLALGTLISMLRERGEYSHIPLIPVISVALIYRERTKIFRGVQSSFLSGMSLLAASLLPFAAAAVYSGRISANDNLSLSSLALVIFWVGSFIVCYGVRAARAALFPLLFLLIMVPLPDLIISSIVHWLQRGSADAAYFFFTMAGVPVLQKGFLFSLPGIEIEVTSECSGIRSSIALFITSLILGHCYLNASWKKILLTVSVLPIVVLRNGLRIFTLAVLGIYVNPSYLHGPLHHRGGIVFYVLSLCVLIPLVKMLQASGHLSHQVCRLSSLGSQVHG